MKIKRIKNHDMLEECKHTNDQPKWKNAIEA